MAPVSSETYRRSNSLRTSLTFTARIWFMLGRGVIDLAIVRIASPKASRNLADFWSVCSLAQRAISSADTTHTSMGSPRHLAMAMCTMRIFISRQPAGEGRPAHLGGNHQGAMDLRASSSATERRTRSQNSATGKKNRRSTASANFASRAASHT